MLTKLVMHFAAAMAAATIITEAEVSYSETPFPVPENTKFVITVTNLNRQGVPSTIYVFPPPNGREVATTDENGKADLTISCDKVTKIQARPIGNAYFVSKHIFCKKNRSSLQIEVYPIKTVRYLGANLLNSVVKKWHGVAALAAYDLRHIDLAANMSLSPISEMKKIEGWTAPVQMKKVVGAWKGVMFAEKINHKYRENSLEEFVDGLESMYLLHPKFYKSIEPGVVLQYGATPPKWIISTPFEVPTGQHAEYLTYVFAARALNVNTLPHFSITENRLVVDRALKDALTQFQTMKGLKVTGDVNYATLEALSGPTIRKIRSTIVLK